MKESVGYDSNPNVYRFDVVLDIRDCLFNVLKRCIIRELLACVVDVLRCVLEVRDAVAWLQPSPGPAQL